MVQKDTADITRLLHQGDQTALEELFPIVYGELREIAGALFRDEYRENHTLQPTALVHEAYLRLRGADGFKFENQAHFFGAAAEAMRRILVDRARQKARVRHGGELERVDLEHVTIATEDSDAAVLAIHEALEKLALESPQKAEIVKLRYFTGLEHADIAQALGLAEPTVRRHWAYARSWLYAELKKEFPKG